MLAWLSVWSEVHTCIRLHGPADATATLASVKSRLVLPFWYRPTWVVLEKWLLNGCVCVCYVVLVIASWVIRTLFSSCRVHLKFRNKWLGEVMTSGKKIPCNLSWSFSRTTRTHPFNGLFPGLPRWASTRKVKPIWILLKQETVSGSGISWTMCKSAPRSRQITTPSPHHSFFYRPDTLLAAQPTASKHWRHFFKNK